MGSAPRELGLTGERAAAQLLRDEGFSVLALNYRQGRYGEIDLIARKENLVVFVEVKSRSTGAFGGGLRSIPESKKRKIRRAAAGYIAENRSLDDRHITFRFDLICMEEGVLRWHPDIFR